MDHTPLRPCAPRARCHDYRRCPICARIRQAKIADAAERLAARAGPLAWTCLSPVEPGADALARARAAFLRATDPPGALWTVELSPETGALHCNIISPAEPPRAMKLARVWHAPINGDVRAVAAYISKREQMPSKLQYPRRLYGTAGPVWAWLSSGAGQPVIAAAKAQYDIDPAPLAADSGVDKRVFVGRDPHTWADYRDIAASRLPDLLRSTPLYGRSRARAEPETSESPRPRAYYRPVLNSRRVRWMTGTLAAWERDWKPKSAR